MWAGTTILRPPGSKNHKHSPPREVTVADSSDAVCAPESLLAELPRVDRSRQSRPAVRSPRRSGNDHLLEIDPRDYVARLLGVEVPRSGFMTCPFHTDRHPSLKVYEQAERGWCCFGRCGRRGGTIFDLAGRLWGLDTPGADFVLLRRRLLSMFPEASSR